MPYQVTHVQGYHVSRLAADLHDFLEALDLDVRPIPSSVHCMFAQLLLGRFQ